LKFTSALTATGAGSKTLTLQGSTNGTGEIAAAIVDNSGTHKTSVVKGGTGAWTLSGTNTNTGTTTINAGTLQLAKQVSLYNNTTASWTAANINVKSGGTLAFNVGGTGEFTTGDFTTLLTNLAASSSATNGMNAGSSFGFDTTNATDGTFTIADVIANSTGTSGGARGLTKLGTNTLILTNTNTYTGATTINAGKLLVHGSTAAGSAFTVNSSATLGGSGTINGTVTLMSGATLSPGASIESLGLGSSAWNGGSTVQIEFSTDGSTGVAGTEWDLLAITGTLDLTGASSSTPVILDLVSMVNATTAGALAVWDENVNANLQSPVLKVSFRRTRRVG
jgi:autotransporter-associated beta strand protein